MEEHNLVFLGDYHLHEFYKVKKDDKDLNFGNSEGNTVWYTDSSHIIKHLQAKFKDHALLSGMPDIVVLGAGGKDLTFRKNTNCVISSILRFVNSLRKQGVKSVVILSLVERNLPPPYNNDVKKINAVLAIKAKHMDGIFFLPYTRKPNLSDCDYTDGILLVPHFYSRFFDILNKLLTKKVLAYVKSPEVLKKTQEKRPFGENIVEHAEKIRELATEKEVAQLTKEIEDLISENSGINQKLKQPNKPKGKQKQLRSKDGR